jgi:hypothetical protein
MTWEQVGDLIGRFIVLGIVLFLFVAPLPFLFFPNDKKDDKPEDKEEDG